jgi:hypothetical protein
MARPKGSTNLQSKAIKDMVIAALDEVGGKSYLVTQARDNPTAFIGLIGKAMPKDMAVEIRRSIFEEDDDSEGTTQG